MLEDIPDRFKTQDMCDDVVSKHPYMIEFVPDYFITREMCDEALKEDPTTTKYIARYNQRRLIRRDILKIYLP